MASNLGPWIKWASENLDVRGMMNWAHDNVDPAQLQKLKDVAAKEVTAGSAAPPPAPTGAAAAPSGDPSAPTGAAAPATASSWSSWISKGTPAPAAAAFPAATPAVKSTTLTTRGVKLAVRHWKISVPVGMWLFSWLLSMFW